MIGTIEKAKFSMIDILKQRRSTRRLMIENIYARTLGKSPRSTIGEVISERVLAAMTGIKSSFLCGIAPTW